MSLAPLIQHFYHTQSGTLSYVVSDVATRKAAVIDPVLGYDRASGRTDHSAVHEIVAYLGSNDLELQWILETHAHADHLSAAQYLKTECGGKVAIGAGICAVQAHFAQLFNLQSLAADGRQFDHLFKDDEDFAIGSLSGKVLATPGHTDDSISYLIGDAVFVGDSLFMMDFGTARCDFPGGDAALLYRSIQKLFALPAETRLFMCHDYCPGGRELRYVATVAEQKANNIHVGNDASEKQFVAMRLERDKALPLPDLILPSVQVNIRAGHLPESEDNGVAYIKIPLDQF